MTRLAPSKPSVPPRGPGWPRRAPACCSLAIRVNTPASLDANGACFPCLRCVTSGRGEARTVDSDGAAVGVLDELHAALLTRITPATRADGITARARRPFRKCGIGRV